MECVSRVVILSDRTDPKHNPIVQEYILPDLSTNRMGRVRQPDDIITETDQILVMNNERFTVPEILFRPDDIGRSRSTYWLLGKPWTLLVVTIRDIHDPSYPGFDQAGIAGTIAHSISLLPSDLQGMFWSNIGLIGGNSKITGFRDRL